jgi:hypothetical protein
MELLTICEEDATNAKPFRQQFLFHRFRLEKVLPPSIQESSMLSLLRKLLLLSSHLMGAATQ